MDGYQYALTADALSQRGILKPPMLNTAMTALTRSQWTAAFSVIVRLSFPSSLTSHPFIVPILSSTLPALAPMPNLLLILLFPFSSPLSPTNRSYSLHYLTKVAVPTPLTRSMETLPPLRRLRVPPRRVTPPRLSPASRSRHPFPRPEPSPVNHGRIFTAEPTRR